MKGVAMFQWIRCRSIWVIPAFMLLFAGNADGFSLKTSTRIGKIVPLEGMVVVRRKTVGITVKPPAMIVYRGDEVLTNAKGKARILLTGGNEVFVGPSSTLYLNKHFQDRYRYTYDLNLKGKLRAKVQRVRGRRFRVKTSTALVDVKGTDFIVDGTAETTQVATFKGLVQLTSIKTEEKVEIPPGRMSSITTVGAVEPPKKVEISVVKDLENTGKTGIKELDTVMKPPPPLDPSIRIEIESEPLPIPEPMPREEPEVKKPEKRAVVASREKADGDKKPDTKKLTKPKPEPAPSLWTFAEEYRRRNRLGFGFGLEAGPYEGSYLFVEYNLTARTQLHLQFSHNSRSSGVNTESISNQDLQRNLRAASFRYFMHDSGLYAGLGGGSSQYEQDYDIDGETTTLAANGSFTMLEVGAQAYGNAFDTTFYMAVGMQYLNTISLNREYDENTVSSDIDDDFTGQTQTHLNLMMISFGWFF